MDSQDIARGPTAAGTPRAWRRFRYPQSVISYGSWLIAFTVIVYSIEYLNIPLDRMFGMFGRMGEILADRYYPADIEYIMDVDYIGSVIETIQMAYLGALFGLLITIPLAWFAAYNMTPSRLFVYPGARFASMCCRAVHETIWTILFVSILGFGMLPGVLALTLFSAGFAAKLFAEEIEAIDMGPVEAMWATGANRLHRDRYLHLGRRLSRRDGGWLLRRRRHGLVPQTKCHADRNRAGGRDHPLDHRVGANFRIDLGLGTEFCHEDEMSGALEIFARLPPILRKITNRRPFK
jgi:ABC-type phosphate/phosphonate transport system permease subunit